MYVRLEYVYTYVHTNEADAGRVGMFDVVTVREM